MVSVVNNNFRLNVEFRPKMKSITKKRNEKQQSKSMKNKMDQNEVI